MAVQNVRTDRAAAGLGAGLFPGTEPRQAGTPAATTSVVAHNFTGHLSLFAAPRANGRTVLAAQSFRAPYHVSKPYWDEAAGTLLVQVVNPTAGILSGDALRSEIAAGRGAMLLVTTPSASRVFQMQDGGSAECRQRFTVAAGAWLEVMPEPLVPHRGSRYRQTTSIEVEPGGELFFVDLLMSGRVAHGEAWAWDRLCLETEIKFGGELVLRERFDQSGADLQGLAALAGFGDGACFGNGVLIADPAEADAGWCRALNALHGEGLWLGVSALRRGGWSLKFVAADGARLRRALSEIRAVLAQHFPRLACDPRKL